MSIRNIAVLAHVDAGKTTLTEHMLFACGEIRRPGNVDDRNTTTDFMQIERERGISVNACSVSMEYKGVKINLTDTPGHADFAGEVERSLVAADGAVLILSAVEGVQAQTSRLWRALRKLGLPTIVYINKIDRIGADCQALVDKLRKSFAPGFFCLNEVLNEATRQADTRSGFNSESLDIVVESDEELLEKYLSGNLKNYELEAHAVKQVLKGELFPVVCGSALHDVGVKQLLDAIITYLPPPDTSGDGLSALVYKVTHDKKMGRIAYIRMFSGELTTRMPLSFGGEGQLSKISRITDLSGKENVGSVKAGDIAAVYGLGGIKTGVSFGAPRIPEGLLAHPLLRVRVYPDDESKYASLYAACEELAAEDPLLNLEWSPATRELILNLMGTIQTEILTAVFQERFALSVSFSKPTVIYKETPSSCGYGFDAYTMPKPCWAVLKFYIEPRPRGFGFSYDADVPNDRLFYRYQEHVKKALPDALKQGLFGWEVTDLYVKLVDGEHHTIHTHPLDFFTCTPMALRDGFRNCGMTLLEPYVALRIEAPEDYAPSLIRDISDMRGEYSDSLRKNGIVVVEGIVPAASLLDYPQKLSISTRGKAMMESEFYEYRPCPPELGVKLPYRGIDPLDRAKYILSVRGAITK